MTLPPVATTRSRRENRGNATIASSPYTSRSVPPPLPPPAYRPPLPCPSGPPAPRWPLSAGGGYQVGGPAPRPRRSYCRGATCSAARPWRSPRARRAAPPRQDGEQAERKDIGGVRMWKVGTRVIVHLWGARRKSARPVTRARTPSPPSPAPRGRRPPLATATPQSRINNLLEIPVF